MKIFISFLAIVFSLNFWAQTPQEFKYQAVVRDGNGQLVSNQLISLKLTILSESSIGTEVYSETQSLATNGYGVISINVGTGSPVFGSFENIDWASTTHFVKTELDLSGGNDFQFMGTSQIVSVPYALHSKTSATSLDDNDKDASNEIQQLTISNDTLTLEEGGSIYLGSYMDNTDSQTLSLDGNSLSISNGNSVVLSGTVDLDADPTNELQVLTLSNDTLYLSDGNFVVIPEDNDADPTNEIQTLAENNGTISISNGNSIDVPDNSASNEIQDLSISGNTLSISQSNSVNLPVDGDGDSNNEIQNLSLSGSDLTISQGNTVTLPPDGDSDDTNELQTLSYDNNTLTISNGNSISFGSSNLDFRYPDPKVGIEIVTHSFTSPETAPPYVVPSSKNLYITNMYYGCNLNSRVQVNGISVQGRTGFNANDDGTTSIFSTPIMAGQNDQVSILTATNCLVSFNGFLVDATVEVVSFELNPSQPYTVPSGKILVVQNVHGQGNIYIDGINYMTTDYPNEHNQSNVSINTTTNLDFKFYQSNPLFFDQNSELTTGGSIQFNGYLINN